MSKRRRDNQLSKPSEHNQAVATVTHQSVTFTGPLPHPDLLAKYDQVIPNGADRIMTMAEQQSRHRESLEERVVAANIKAQARGALYAFILCLVVILGGFALIWNGKSIIGISAILTSLVGLAGVFLVSRWEQRKERVQKESALTERGKR